LASTVLTIWVALSQVAAPSTGAMLQAASQMLGPGIKVRTVAFPDQQPEAVQAPSVGEESATLAWDSAEHEHAHLRFCRHEHGCSEHWLTFSSADPEAERGRTLGFLAAALFAEANPMSAPAAAPAEASAPVSERALPARAPERREFPHAEVTAAVAAAGPGNSSGLGVRMVGAYATSRRVRLGLGGEMRFGEVPEAQASSRIAALAADLWWLPWHPAQSVWLGASASAGAYYLTISHFSSDDREPVRQGRILPGGSGTLAGTLDFGRSSGLELELGVELLAGRSTLEVHQQVRAVWPVATPIARLGIRAGF
jgi:hypothetical protein